MQKKICSCFNKHMQNVGSLTKDKILYSSVKPPEAKAQEPAKTQAGKSDNKTNLIIGSLAAAGLIGLSGVIIAQRGNIQKLKKALNSAGSQISGAENPPKTETLIPYNILSLEECGLYQIFKNEKSGFIRFLKNSNAEPQKIKEFLFSITSDEKTAGEFIKEVIKNPRKSGEILNVLQEKIGGWKNLSEWFMAPGGYQEAYTKLFRNLVKNMPVDEMIKLSPNWHIHYLMHKCDGNIRFGKLPEEFQNIKDYTHFVNWLTDIRRQIGHQGKETYKKPVLLEYGGQHFNMLPLQEGLSGKYAMKLQFINPETGEPGKPYVLKVQELYGCNSNHAAQESFAYRPDSSFLNAQMDYYMNLHNCENTVKFHFFDYASNSGLYDYVDGVRTVQTENLIEGNKLIEDMNLLGIHYNDVCITNIIDVNGKYKVIDIGDSSFIDPLRPGIKGIQFEFANGCGISPPNFALALKQ